MPAKRKAGIIAVSLVILISLMGVMQVSRGKLKARAIGFSLHPDKPGIRVKLSYRGSGKVVVTPDAEVDIDGESDQVFVNHELAYQELQGPFEEEITLEGTFLFNAGKVGLVYSKSNQLIDLTKLGFPPVQMVWVEDFVPLSEEEKRKFWLLERALYSERMAGQPASSEKDVGEKEKASE